MPPTALRRPVTVLTWLVLSAVCLLLSPLIIAVGAVAARVLGRPQPRLLAQMFLSYCAHELGVLVGAGALWVWSGFGRRMQAQSVQLLHYRLLNWFVYGLAARVRSLLDIHVSVDVSDEVRQVLSADRPILFFSRHAGPGDTLLLAELLVGRYRRHLSVVFKEALTIDPAIDLLGHRLPHAVLNTDDLDDCKARIQEVTAHLGPRGLLMLFPEGGNFTSERRSRALRSLREKGLRRQASAGSQMTHMMPPHPSGALAALAANPSADVVFAAHCGLGLAAFPRQLWQTVPMSETLTVRMWLSPADERPQDADGQVDWLYAWWKRLDQWVDERGDEES